MSLYTNRNWVLKLLLAHTASYYIININTFHFVMYIFVTRNGSGLGPQIISNPKEASAATVGGSLNKLIILLFVL